jgi:hypothetical protein
MSILKCKLNDRNSLISDIEEILGELVSDLNRKSELYQLLREYRKKNRYTHGVIAVSLFATRQKSQESLCLYFIVIQRLLSNYKKYPSTKEFYDGMLNLNENLSFIFAEI